MLTVWRKTADAYRKGGVVRVTRGAARFAVRGLTRAAEKLGLRRALPFSVVVLAPDGVSATRTVRANVYTGRHRPEVIVLGYGRKGREADRMSARARCYQTPETDLPILANTAVALARREYVMFARPGTAPAWRVDRRLRPLMEGGEADVILLGEGLEDVIVRRRALITCGGFRPEAGHAFVSDALESMRKAGYRFCIVEPEGVRLPAPERPPRDEARPPRVVYVVNGTDVRGGIRIVFEHCNRLRDRGIETLISSFEDPFQAWFPGLRAPLVRVADLPPTDVAVATFWLTAPFVAELDCARFYFVQHDEALFSEEEWWREEVRRTYALPFEFVTISSWLAEHIRQLADKTAALLPNGINREMFFPDPVYPRTGKVRVLVEGNKAILWKGLDEARQALAGMDVEVWCLGDTGIPCSRELRYPPQDEVRRIYSSCDILLKTSWYEGMPLPHMEAMACGCTLLTTDVPGVRDYCVDGWNCLMAEPRNVADIREKLVRLVEDAELRGSLARNGLRTAREHFGWDDKIDALAELYRTAAAAVRARPAAPRPAAPRPAAPRPAAPRPA